MLLMNIYDSIHYSLPVEVVESPLVKTFWTCSQGTNSKRGEVSEVLIT